MIYGKMWLVVKPSVGIPLFLSAVAITSLAVHVALVVNTTWIKKYLNGSAAVATTADSGSTTVVAVAPPVAK